MEAYPHIEKTPQTEAEWFDALIRLARFLRSPAGCPWDRKQTAHSFAAFIREEAAELCEALDHEDNEHAQEEWGDTLFTLLATMAAAETEGRFKLKRALELAHEKMIRRHGHIFGEHKAETPEEVADVWQKIKAQEKESKSNGDK